MLAAGNDSARGNDKYRVIKDADGLRDARALRASFGAAQAADAENAATTEGASPCALPHRPHAIPLATNERMAMPRRPKAETNPTLDSET